MTNALAYSRLALVNALKSFMRPVLRDISADKLWVNALIFNYHGLATESYFSGAF